MPTHPTSQTEWDDGKRRVVILGGGFAGVSVARRLERLLPQQWDIFLLSKSNVITYNPLLPEVVGATLLPGHAVAPLRHILGRTRIRMVEVTNVDLEQRYVEYNQPSPDRIRFDHLVLACGLTARMDVVPGMADHGVPLKSLGDALYVRNQTIGQLEEATLCYDPQRNRCLTSFIVAGGGFSGVEAAGELQDLLNSAAPLFKRVAADSCHVHLVQLGPGATTRGVACPGALYPASYGETWHPCTFEQSRSLGGCRPCVAERWHRATRGDGGKHHRHDTTSVYQPFANRQRTRSNPGRRTSTGTGHGWHLGPG